MSMSVHLLLRSPRRSARLFLLLVAVALGIAWGVLGILKGHPAPRALVGALTLDLVFVLPVLYYSLVVTPRRWPKLTVFPFAVLCYGLSTVMIPQQLQIPLSDFLGQTILPTLFFLTLFGLAFYPILRMLRVEGAEPSPDRL